MVLNEKMIKSVWSSAWLFHAISLLITSLRTTIWEIIHDKIFSDNFQ